MQPFGLHRGLVAPLNRVNVDTDQIIPKQFLKRVERSGFGKFLFHDWRQQADGAPEPEFVLNQPRYRDATILAAGRNFGCGSSREHAPWALSDYGFRAIIAPSFADIFANNCLKNGLLTVALPEDVAHEIIERATRGSGYQLTVDLEQQIVHDDSGLRAAFTIDGFSRRRLLEGLDDTRLTLQYERYIAEYEAKHFALSASQRHSK